MKKKLFSLLILFIMLSTILLAGVPKIFIVSSYDKSYSWNKEIVEAIEAVLNTAEVERRYFYMDTRLKDDDEWKIKTGEMALDILKEWQPDVVIACDDNAQQYFVKKIPSKAPVQVVFCGINKDPSEYDFPNETVTGIQELPFPVESLNEVSKIIPNLKKIAFIGDDTRSAKGHIEYLKSLDMGKYESIGYYKFSNMENLLLGIKNLSKICDVFYFIRTLGFKDKNGVQLTPSESMKMILESTDIPVMGLSDYIVENGAVYGIVPDPEFQGTVAAKIALLLAFKQKDASEIPVVKFTSDFSALEDGKSYLNLNTTSLKGYEVPIDLINETDVVISSMAREDEIVLDYYTLISGQMFKTVVTYLRDLATKAFTRDGNWEAIKGDYQNTTVNYPGIFLYILPNGDYYTDIRNFTSNNLMDRPYFKMLKEGKEVLGYPVISRSTGKKSAVYAIPVEKNGEISGYTGMSLYMEELNAAVNNIMNLDSDVFIMAVDQSGTVMMTNQEQYMFTPADDAVSCGSKNFTELINAQKRGHIAFANGYGHYFGSFTTEETTGWKFVLAKKFHDTYQNTSIKEMIDQTAFLKEIVGEKINTLEEQLIRVSKTFADSNELPEDVRAILEKLYSEIPKAFDVAFVNTKGIMEYIAPHKYSDFEGTDISNQEQIRRIAKTYNPVVSELLMTAEGVYGIDIEWPVFNKRGVFMGSVSILIEPETYFNELLMQHISDPELEIWIMQEDGTIVYDLDEHEIGKNLFNDDIYSDYPELQTIGKEMLEKNNGIGEYVFLAAGEDTAKRKRAVWNTIYFHGTEWKIVLVRLQ